MADPQILILLASRNGADWIDAQLRSIAAQDYENWALWISDDGSTDATRQIIADFAAARAGRNRVVLVEGPRAGSAGANFLHLLARPELPIRSDTYIAFADQDDLWYPGKLRRALEILAGVPGAALYGAQSRHVDAAGRPTGSLSRHPKGGPPKDSAAPAPRSADLPGPPLAAVTSARETSAGATASGAISWPEPVLSQPPIPAAGGKAAPHFPAPTLAARECYPAPPLGNLLVQNLVSGHSAVLNPAAIASARAQPWDPALPFHDWWLAQLIAATGGSLLIDRQIVLDYRQHGTNVLGSPGRSAARLQRLSLLRQRRYAAWLRANLTALERAELTAEAREIITALLALPPAGLRRLLGLRRLGLHRQSRIGTGALMAAALLGLA